jgi:aspartyl-tRNA(Asn)/glutamyl-tRNA(Gln) amidotransferase subunit A
LDPVAASAVELTKWFCAGKLSPLEATIAILDRIAVCAPLNAFCFVDHEGAIAAAEASTERYASGSVLSPLDGVPVGIKDLILTRDMPTRRGSLTTSASEPWEHDAPVAARLRAAGAVILGKTTTPEFGWKGVTDSPLTGITRNPWNPAKTPGGSSGGAAVQVAAGMGPISIGTDGGGSIRIPSSFTGVFGLKPSFGRVPAWPGSQVGTLAHTGPMTRCVADAALAMSVITGWDARDFTALPYESIDWMSATRSSLKGKRIAYSRDLGLGGVDAEVAALVDRAAMAMRELGAIVEEIDPGIGQQGAVISVLWQVGCAKGQMGMSDADKALLDPGLREAAIAGAKYSLEDYLKALDARAALGARMREFHRNWDFLVLPTMPGTAFDVGMNAPRLPDGSFKRDWSPFCYNFNLTQQPAASLPCGFTSAGLPVGLQIVGRMHDDLGVLGACHALEAAVSPMTFPPLPEAL